ncbi:MAG TPA: Ig-like domain-containing protein [Candidatus Brocadiia bacterium]|nr:Ig-like domain-containing protein [Candidatus Brocadiia bacterium]
MVNSASATVTITVTSVNDAPTAQSITATTSEDAQTIITLLGSDVEGSGLTYTIVSAPANGILTGTGSSRTYKPSANFNGTDTFTYRVSDGALNSSDATVTVTVTPVNDAPAADAKSLVTDEDVAVAVTLSGADVDGDALSFAVLSGPLHGTLSGSGANLTYTPDANYNGGDSFVYAANDGMVNSASATVTITVTSINDAPTASSQSVATGRNVPRTVTLLGGDADGDALTYRIVGLPANGIVSLDGSEATYAPNPGFSGTDVLTFVASDGQAESGTAAITISVSSGTPPVASAQNVYTNEDNASSITLFGSDADGDVLTYAITSQPLNGTLTGSGNEWTYTPAPDFSGSDQFRFTVNDGLFTSAAAAVTIVIGQVNDPPIAQNRSASATEDNPVAVALRGTDPEGASLAYLIVDAPSHGTLSGGGQTPTYTPDPDWNGSDSFTYRVSDGELFSNTATVTVSVAPVNDAPTAHAKNVATSEDIAVAVTLSGSDVEGDALSFIVISSPLHGTLSGSGANLTYTPATNFNGSDSFVYLANDGLADSAEATVTIAVAPVNDAPAAQSQSLTTVHDTPVVVTLSGYDLEGDTLTYSLAGLPVHGTAVISGNEVTYTPDALYTGADSFTFTANDGEFASAPATVSISISNGIIPVADPQNVATSEDTSLPITLSGSDHDGDPLTFILGTLPAHGTLAGSGADLTYAPAADFNGSDTFTFRVHDGIFFSEFATVTITVNPVNDLPKAQNRSAATPEDVSVIVGLRGSDVDGDALTYTIVSPPQHGILSGSGVNVTYTPDANWSGTDSFTYRVNDGAGDSNTATATITVAPVNDAPAVSDMSVSTDEDVPLAIIPGGSDADGDALSYVITVQPSHGALSVAGGTLTYAPQADFFGADSFRFIATDGQADSAEATASITINPVNDPPVSFDQTVATMRETPVDAVLDSWDIENDVLTYRIVADPAHGTVILEGGTATYTPAAGFAGVDSFSFVANDGTADGAPAIVTISVEAGGAPSATPQNVETPEDAALAITLAGSDPDSDALTYRIVRQPRHGVLSGTGREWTYTPSSDYNGADDFRFVVNDGMFDSPTATVGINVIAVNDAPIAQNISAEIVEDSEVGVTLSGSDAEGQTLSFVILTGPAHGVLEGSGAARTYVPDPDYFGPDSFTYLVNDGELDSATATAAIVVTPVNDPPTASDLSIGTTEGVSVEIALAGGDIEGQPLSFDITIAPLHGVITGTGASRTYVPAPDFFGADSFTYVANDGEFESAAATVTINVTPINDPPTAGNFGVETTEDASVAVGLVGTDPEGTAVTFEIVTAPQHGILQGEGADRTYVPEPNYFGTDSFTYLANDGELDSATATVTITVAPVNDAPTADDISVATSEDSPVEVNLAGSDVEGAPLTYEIMTPPLHGVLTGAGASRTYIPEPDFFGADSFTYVSNDGEFESAIATVTINVTPVNDAPTAGNISAATAEDSPVDISLSGSDIEGQPLAFIIVSGPQHGTLDGSGSTRTYVPAPNYFGPDGFAYLVNDGELDSAAASVTIDVTPVNDLPVVGGMDLTTDSGVPVNFSLSGDDIEDEALSFRIITPPAHGTVTGTGADRIYTPNPGFSGIDTLTYVANDGSADSAPGTITITVIADADIAVHERVGIVDDNAIPFSSLVVGESAQTVVTVANDGGRPLTVSAWASDSGDFIVTPLNAAGPDGDVVLDPGETTEFVVTFSPDSVGKKAGTLTINSSDADEPVWTIELSGTSAPALVGTVDVNGVKVHILDTDGIGVGKAIDGFYSVSGYSPFDATNELVILPGGPGTANVFMRGEFTGLGLATDGSFGTIAEFGRIGPQREIAFVAAKRNIGTVISWGGIPGVDSNGLTMAPGWTMPDDIDGDGDVHDRTAVYAANGYALKVLALGAKDGVALGGDVLATDFIIMVLGGYTAPGDMAGDVRSTAGWVGTVWTGGDLLGDVSAADFINAVYAKGDIASPGGHTISAVNRISSIFAGGGISQDVTVSRGDIGSLIALKGDIRATIAAKRNISVVYAGGAFAGEIAAGERIGAIMADRIAGPDGGRSNILAGLSLGSLKVGKDMLDANIGVGTQTLPAGSLAQIGSISVGGNMQRVNVLVGLWADPSGTDPFTDGSELFAPSIPPALAGRGSLGVVYVGGVLGTPGAADKFWGIAAKNTVGAVIHSGGRGSINDVLVTTA